MHTLTTVDGALVGPARSDPASPLDDQAQVRYHRAVARLPWTQRHRRSVGLRDGEGQVLARADRVDLDVVLHGRTIRCCGLGNICEAQRGTGRHAAELVSRIADDEEASGVDAVLVSSAEPYWSLSDRFTAMVTHDVTLKVNESSRRGAPMLPARSGERSDLVHLASLQPIGVAGVRLARSAELIDFSITRHRLLAALSPAGSRHMHFLVAEEGMRAVAYVIITVTRDGWRLEECGDHDPTGARVGALLQVLLARETAERRPRITADLPSGFQPPQVSMGSPIAARPRLWLKVFGDDARTMAGPDARIAWWPGDPPGGM